MSALKDDLKKSGYSQEESYFHQENQRLIQELRKQQEGPESGNNVVHAEDRFRSKSKLESGESQKKAA